MIQSSIPIESIVLDWSHIEWWFSLSVSDSLLLCLSAVCRSVCLWFSVALTVCSLSVCLSLSVSLNLSCCLCLCLPLLFLLNCFLISFLNTLCFWVFLSRSLLFFLYIWFTFPKHLTFLLHHQYRTEIWIKVALWFMKAVVLYRYIPWVLFSNTLSFNLLPRAL